MKLILKYLKEYKKEAILAPLFKMLEAIFELFVPLVIARLIDVGIANSEKNIVVQCAALLFALALIGLASSITAQFFAAKAAISSATNLRLDLFKRIQCFSYSDIDEIGTDTMLTRLTSDLNLVQTGINMTLRLFLRSPFIVFGAMLMAFTINVRAALIFAITIPVLAIVVYGIMAKSIPLYKIVQKKLDSLLSITRENISGVRVIRAFGIENEETQEFNDRNTSLHNLQNKVGSLSGMEGPITFVLVNAATIILLYSGAIKVDQGILTRGEVVALVNYMSQILVELIKLANLIVTMSKGLAGAERIEEIMLCKLYDKDDSDDLYISSCEDKIDRLCQPNDIMQDTIINKIDEKIANIGSVKRKDRTENARLCQPNDIMQDTIINKIDGKIANIGSIERKGRTENARLCQPNDIMQDTIINKIDGKIANIGSVERKDRTENDRLCQPENTTEDAELCKPILEFDNISLIYSGNSEPSLSDISFNVYKGQTIGIIGGTGSGKSSLVNIIPRLYPATTGKIFYKGIPIENVDENIIRKNIAIVLQKAVLFKGTVADNLRFGRSGISDDKLIEALKVAQAYDFVMQKEGLDTKVQQGGANFSGGQKQRLHIARALAGDPEILILDDSSSALDFATDAALRKSINDYNPECTVFIVSQRTSSIMNADLILVLDDGKLVGRGTHSELLAGCEIYAEIHKL